MDDINFDFAGDEDFGLAKSFSKAPLGLIQPCMANENMQREFSNDEIVGNDMVFDNTPGIDNF